MIHIVTEFTRYLRRATRKVYNAVHVYPRDNGKTCNLLEHLVDLGCADVARSKKMFSRMQKIPMWKECFPVPRGQSLVQMDRRDM